MNIFNQVKSFFGASTGGCASSTVVTIDQFTSNLLYTSTYAQLAREGYIENVISHTCISRIAQEVAHLPFEVFIGDTNIDEMSTPLARDFKELLKNPNVDYDWPSLIEGIMVYKPIDGRAYIWPQMSEFGSSRPLKIEYLRPDRVSVINSQDERISEYQYNRGSQRVIFQRDDEGYFDLIDWRQFNPLSDTRGLSTLNPAGLNIDSYTEANKHNKQVVSNGGKPSGVISLQDAESSGQIDEDELIKLKDMISQAMNKNKGGYAVLNGPYKFEKMAFTNNEMDWLNGIKANAISICNAHGFPPFLLGLESTTFSNQDAANLELTERTVIPRGQRLYNLLGAFYSRKTGLDITFKVKLSKVTSLAPRFKEMREQARDDFAAGIITLNEAREEQSREPIDGGDDILVDQNKPNGFTPEA